MSTLAATSRHRRAERYMASRILISVIALALGVSSVGEAKPRKRNSKAKTVKATVAQPVVAACPVGAKWNKVLDESPMSRCRPRPLEEGCTLPDGRKHGPWNIMDRATGCRLPSSQGQFVKGRRHGVETTWRNDCTKKPCTARKGEEGPWADDHRHGIWTIFRDDGTVSERGNWFEGKQHGPWQQFSADRQTVVTICYQVDKVAWQSEPQAVAKDGTAPAPAPKPCPTVIDKRDDDGTKTVSAAEQKASKMVRMAQASTIAKLRLLYLRKAVALVPANKHYRALLEAAQ